MSAVGQQRDPLAPPAGRRRRFRFGANDGARAFGAIDGCSRRRRATYGVDVHTTPIETALTGVKPFTLFAALNARARGARRFQRALT
jgi:hypothetical protein